MPFWLPRLFDPFTVLFVLALVAVWRLRTSGALTRRQWRRLALPVVGLALLSTPAVGWLLLGALEWNYPPLVERPPETQAIVVLGGGVFAPSRWDPSTRIGEATLHRCLRAVELYKQGPPCTIVVAGGRPDPSSKSLTEARVMSDFLILSGVQPTDIRVEESSTNTFENALNTQQLLRPDMADGTRRILLVTDGAHLCRASRCLSKQGFIVTPAGCRYLAIDPPTSPLSYVPRPEGASTTKAALHEYVGLAWYWLRGRI